MKLSFDRKGISEQVADHIKQVIQDGKYKVGEKIPGEREMAAELEVSRNTVREAYKILEAYGYVIARHGTGVFVASEEEQIRKMTGSFFVTSDQVKDLFAVRKILEDSTVEWAILNSSEQEIEELSRIVFQAKNAANAAVVDFQQLSELDHKFHLVLAKMAQNSVLNRIMHNLIDLLGKSRMQSIQIPGRAIQSIEEHEEIVKAIKTKNISDAKKHMTHHLESVEESITNSLKRKDE
ncbi:FadR/GntR family transcriptional regulator [Metabacillus arenae]|uniref:FadR family transcriptional regulator n=1 Tax=Metabacillus arenae TaxID=2771434 RepID=A0A926RXF0_9BACI|nr:FadR/GntR family transcriptional regulator [Metabacillus arenae]MBD1380600.1 FadR family transcriptional regulator [Metabacillus arenae]